MYLFQSWTVDADIMKMNMQYKINLFGWILVILGTILYIIGFVSEITRTNPTPYKLWDEVKTIREIFMPPSVILIFGGIVLSFMDIVPSNGKKIFFKH